MRKQFTIFFILIFILGLVPVNFSEAITQNQIDSEVQIVCPDNYGNWFSGSGTIIDPRGIILTNRHVVTDEKGGLIESCYVGFMESINAEPNFGTEINPNIAEVKYYTSSNDMDAAILYLDNKTNSIYPYINIWDSDSNLLKFGDKLEVIGFPGIGGSTITYTSGDFSGFGSKSDDTQNYIKTSAPLEHGNSGGASYNAQSLFMGIPTMVVAGSLNSLSYILSVNSIKAWLSGILGSSYKQEIINQKPAIEKPVVNIQDDITPPDIINFKIEFLKVIKNNAGQEELTQAGVSWQANYVVDKFNKIGFTLSGAKDKESEIDGYYFYFGTELNTDPVNKGDFVKYQKEFQVIPKTFMIDREGTYYFIVSVKDMAGNISSPFVAVYNYEKDYYKKIDSISFYKDNNYKVGLGKYNFNFVEDPSEYLGNGIWSRYFNSFSDELICKTRLKNIYIEWDYTGNLDKNGSIVKVLNKSNMEKIESGEFVKNNRYFVNNINTGMKVSSSMEVYGLNKNEIGGIWQEILQPNDKINYNFYIKPYIKNSDVFNKHKLLNLIYDPKIDKDITCISKDDLYKNKVTNIKYDSKNPLNFYRRDIKYNSLEKIEGNSILNGKILLQVESHGEAWYVNPQNSKRYYMANGDEAYRIMRYLGVGITNSNLQKIKIDKFFAKKNSGRIFLQVESLGEAYYIDFNGVAHYLKNGEAAYTIMRELGLGITNSDLNKIPDSQL